MMLFIIIFLISLVLFILYLIVGLYMEKTICRPQKRDYDKVKEEEFSCDNFIDKSYYEKQYPEIFIKNKNNKKLCGHYFKCDHITNKYLLFNHGYNYPFSSVIKYLPMFNDFGYNVLFPDHIGEGKSDNGPITFGFYENEDSELWMNELEKISKKDNIENPIFGVMGESMGGAISIMMASINVNERISFCISDCPYSSWHGIIKHRLIQDKIPYMKFFIPALAIILFMKYRVKFYSINILKYAKQVKIPTLIIHGCNDNYTTCEMSKEIKKANDNFELFLQPKADHARSISTDYVKYKKIVSSFLSKNNFL